MRSAQAECIFVRAARLIEIPKQLRDETEVVAIGRHAAEVPDLLSDRKGAGVAVRRTPQLTTILTDAAERSQCVERRPTVADQLREPPRLLEIRLRTVEFTGTIEPRADVADRRGDARRIGQRCRTPRALTPREDCAVRAGAPQRRVTRPPDAVGGDLGDALLRRPGGEPGDLPEREGIPPRLGVRLRQSVGCAEGGGRSARV